MQRAAHVLRCVVPSGTLLHCGWQQSPSAVHNWNGSSFAASPRRLSGLLRVIVHASQEHFGVPFGRTRCDFPFLIWRRGEWFRYGGGLVQRMASVWSGRGVLDAGAGLNDARDSGIGTSEMGVQNREVGQKHVANGGGGRNEATKTSKRTLFGL